MSVSTLPATAPVAQTAPAPSEAPAPPALKPMGLGSAVFYFGGPALLFIFAIWGLRPYLQTLGLSTAEATSWAVGSMAAILLVIALAAYRMEGNSWNWMSFRTRYRLHGISGTGWLWTLGGFLVMVVSVFGLSPLRDSTMEQLGVSMPEVTYTANVLGLSIMLLFVVLGEDLWWRGYVLPRQELAHGRWAWFVHGTGWTLFHVATWWELPTDWLGALAVSFVAQRLKNTTPAIVMHFVFNFIGVLVVAAGLST